MTDDWLDTVTLSTRCKTILQRLGYRTPDMIRAFGWDEFLCTPGCSIKFVHEVGRAIGGWRVPVDRTKLQQDFDAQLVELDQQIAALQSKKTDLIAEQDRLMTLLDNREDDDFPDWLDRHIP